MTREELLKTAKPILFNTEMVRAILDGRKSVTRRVLKLHNAIKAKKCEYKQGSGLWYDDTFNEGDKDTHIKDYSVSCCWIGTKIYLQKYAPYKVGDYLYVRETWGIYEQNYMDANYILFRADFPNGAKTFDADGVSCDLPTWRPSIHMPKEAARIFLRVTDVRVERLQDITKDGLIAEGAETDEYLDYEEWATAVAPPGSRMITLWDYFPGLWNSTVKKSDLDKYGWDANPWVWVIEFERVEAV